MSLMHGERRMVCNGCHETIIVGGYTADLHPDTYRGVACGCRQPTAASSDSPMAQTIARAQRRQPSSLVPVPPSKDTAS